MDRQDLCQACQEELASASELCPFLPTLEDHLKRCPACQSFEAAVKEITHLAHMERAEPSSGLVERAMEQLQPELAGRARETFRVRARLALAGLVSLPVIVGLNSLLIWAVYSSLETWVSEPMATLAAYVVAASALLGLSLTYGSLPIIAEWGLELRQRCRAFTASASAVPRELGANVTGSAQ